MRLGPSASPLIGLFVAVGLAFGGVVFAQDEEPPGGKGLLDEFNVDVQRGADTARVAAGLTFGDVHARGYWWSYGARLLWTQYLDRGPRVRGWGVGGVATLGYRPERWVSPVGGLALDRVFGTDGRFDWQTTVHAGARVRLSKGAAEHFTITFALYRQQIFGQGGFADRGDTGLAVLYSAAVFEPAR